MLFKLAFENLFDKPCVSAHALEYLGFSYRVMKHIPMHGLDLFDLVIDLCELSACWDIPNTPVAIHCIKISVMVGPILLIFLKANYTY